MFGLKFANVIPKEFKHRAAIFNNIAAGNDTLTHSENF
ncbi:hypothetical protein D1BOALGB6SA_9595 [Olavius sp. associated proteobacterium Delta 1]|nr:hypothetical protein D1BOALGB6SA_9595 [Olavius sp. associated proteobacterium Delta 1]